MKRSSVMPAREDLPTPSARAILRAQIEAQTDRFLAAGGRVQSASASVPIVPWAHTDNQAKKFLMSLSFLSRNHAIDYDTLLASMNNPGAPTVYSHAGELKVNRSEGKQWVKRLSEAQQAEKESKNAR